MMRNFKGGTLATTGAGAGIAGGSGGVSQVSTRGSLGGREVKNLLRRPADLRLDKAGATLAGAPPPAAGRLTGRLTGAPPVAGAPADLSTGVTDSKRPEIGE